MRAVRSSWPTMMAVVSVLGVLGAPAATPSAAVIAVLALLWAASSLRLQADWSTLAEPVRMVHLTGGALAVSTFVLLASVNVTGASGSVVIQGALIVAGPLLLLLGHSLVQSAGQGYRRIRRDDLMDALAHLMLPLALTTTLVWPHASGSTDLLQPRLMGAAVTALAAVVFTGGVVTVLARPSGHAPPTLLAAATTSLGLLGWLSVIVWVQEMDLRLLFPRLLVIPTAGYLAAVDRGELQLLSKQQRRPTERLPVSGEERGQRWVTYAASGTATMLLAAVASSIIPVLFAASIGGLAVIRLAAQSARAVRSDHVVDTFDRLVRELAMASDGEDAVAAARAATRRLLGADAELRVGSSVGEANADSRLTNAVLSRRGLVQAWTPDVVTADQTRAVRHLVDLLELVLDRSSTETTTRAVAADPDDGLAIDDVVDGAIDLIEPRSAERIDRNSGLPNLHDFELQDELSGVVVTVIYLHDLERVKESVGSEAGDSFVRRLAARTRRSFRESHDRIWRGDGSKLIVMTPILSSRSSQPGGAERSPIDHRAWIEARRVSLSSPTALGMSFIAPVISAGFTVVKSPMPATEALQQAEMALMFARDNQPRSTVEYSSELHARMAREWQIESYLAAGLDDLAGAGFSVHYQPIIDVASGLVKAVEGLCRWQHTELGTVTPGEFIPIAERSGVVSQIDDFVLAQAIEDVPRFRSIDPDMVVQVNMSPLGLEAARLSETAKTILRRLGGDDPGITVEITESALTNQPTAELAQVFSFLREANIGIGLDDFGTGESNFERLSRLPFTQVKLAHDFVRSNDAVLVSNVVHLVHDLGMTCVVEGVETPAQYELARAGGGDLVQGWVFAKAMPREDALRYCVVRRESVQVPDGEESSSWNRGLDATIRPGSDLGAGEKASVLGSHHSSAEGHEDEAGH